MATRIHWSRQGFFKHKIVFFFLPINLNMYFGFNICFGRLIETVLFSTHMYFG